MTRKAPVSEAPAIPDWVVTFGDMISLLVTFFILLMTYSSREKEEYSKMLGSLTGAFGVIVSPESAKEKAIVDPPPTIQNRVARDGLRTSRLDLDRIQEAAETLVRKPGVGDLIDLERTTQGLRIRIQLDTTFRPGSDWLLPETVRVLKEVGDLLRIHSHPIIVVGHAWQEGGAFASEDAIWSLSRGRALAAADWLIRSGGVPASRVSACARGDLQPIDTGAQTNSRNRRLEIMVVPD